MCDSLIPSTLFWTSHSFRNSLIYEHISYYTIVRGQMVMFISTSHFFPKNYLFQLFPYTSFRYYCCWKTLLLISWSSIPCLRDDKIWLGLCIYSSSCGKRSHIVWNNMERVIETKLSKVSQHLSLVLVNDVRLKHLKTEALCLSTGKISKISNL